MVSLRWAFVHWEAAREVSASGVGAQTNTWYHIAGICDGTTASIYVDGQLMNSSTVDGGYMGTAAGVRIGGEVCCGGDNFAGLIDEVTIYNRALAPDEIAAIYAAGSQGKNRSALAGPQVGDFTGRSSTLAVCWLDKPRTSPSRCATLAARP